MRRWLLVSVWLICLAMPVGVSAQEPPHLELIQGLRERGYHDLALEYLLKLQARTEPPLPAELKAVLPLEIARGQASAAAQLADVARRNELMKKVRDDLKTFVANPANAKHPMLGEAQFDLAKLLLDGARAKASDLEALPAKDKTRPDKLKETVAAFDETGKSFTEAVKNLEQAWRDVKEDPKDKKSVADRQKVLDTFLNALYLQGITLFEKSTALEKDDLAGSSDAMKAVRVAFDNLGSYRDKSPLGWQGLAWVGRCYEGSDLNKQKDAYDRVRSEKKPEAIPGQRLLRYFDLMNKYKAGGGKAERNALRQGFEKWLTDYAATTNKEAPAVLASREGQHVRYMLGTIYLEELREMTPNDRKSPLGQSMVDKGLAIFDSLEDTSGEFAAPSKYQKFQVLRLSGRATAKAIKDLKTFDECLLRARLAVQDAADASGELTSADDDKAKQEIRQRIRGHYEIVRDAMQRGLTMIPEDVEDSNWEMGHQLLYSGYFRTGDYLRAAVLVEHMAHNARKPDCVRKFAVEALKRLPQDRRHEPQSGRQRAAGRHGRVAGEALS